MESCFIPTSSPWLASSFVIPPFPHSKCNTRSPGRKIAHECPKPCRSHRLCNCAGTRQCTEGQMVRKVDDDQNSASLQFALSQAVIDSCSRGKAGMDKEVPRSPTATIPPPNSARRGKEQPPLSMAPACVMASMKSSPGGASPACSANHSSHESFHDSMIVGPFQRPPCRTNNNNLTCPGTRCAARMREIHVPCFSKGRCPNCKSIEPREFPRLNDCRTVPAAAMQNK